MPAVYEAPRVRLTVYCSPAAFRLLTEIGTRWFECMAAHQSNITNAAIAYSPDICAPLDQSRLTRFQASWKVANETDAARLREVVEVWPYLSASKQHELVEYMQTVCGR